MATATILSICNRSLLAIGSQTQISNINEGSTQANAASVLFTPTFETLARTAYWNCFRKQVVLSLIAAAQGTPENPSGSTYPLPPTPWLYSYQLPSDSLMARFIVPSFPATGNNVMSAAFVPAQSWLPGQGQIRFTVAYATDKLNNPLQVILTNQTQAQLVYTVNQQNPAIWDSSFTEAMVAALAVKLCPALSLNMPMMQMQISIAERLIAEARVRDGDEGSSQQDHQPDWISARNVGGGYEWLNGGCYGQYSNMSW